MAKAKPFIKWVGRKSQLIEQLDAQLPADFDNWNDATYIFATSSNARNINNLPNKRVVSV